MILEKDQAGFRPVIPVIDNLFVSRNIREVCWEYKVDIYYIISADRL